MVAVLYMLIGVGGKCLEEQHVQRIEFLERQVSRLAELVIHYRNKYGYIVPKSDLSVSKEGNNTT